MIHLTVRAKGRELFLAGGISALAAGLFLWPGEAAQAVREGALLCGDLIVPALFPFLLLSALVVELDLSRHLGNLLAPLMVPLFRVNGSCGTALALGLVGGYPVGARTAIRLYRSGQCSRTEAERLLAFCNNCGPAFLLGVVGNGLFHSRRAGLLLYAAHLLAALAVGLLFRGFRSQDGPTSGSPASGSGLPFSAALTKSVGSALSGCLSITAFVLTFSVLLRLLAHSGGLDLCTELLSRLGLQRRWTRPLLTGLLELSSGVAALTDGPVPRRLALAAFLLGWGGLSVHCQVLAARGDCDLSLRPYFLGKCLHGLLSACFTLGFFRFFHLEEDISCLSQPVPPGPLGIYGTFTCFSAASLLFWTGMMIFSSFTAKYAIEKRGRL